MGLDGCGKCVKFTMFAANFLILLGGIAVLAVGIWTCADKSSFHRVVGSDLYLSAAYILIASGCVVIIISFIGCLGAVRENKCLLVTYFIILLIIFLIMLVGGILGYVFRGQMQDKMKDKMLNSIKDDYDTDGDVQEIWHEIQNEFKCCGVKTKPSEKSYRIWEQRKNKGQGSLLPESCCKPGAAGDCKDGSVTKPPYEKDCYDALYEAISTNALVVGGVGIGIACILILGMVFACILFKMIE